MAKIIFKHIFTLAICLSLVIFSAKAANEAECEVGALEAIGDCSTYRHCADYAKWVVKKCLPGLLFDKNLRVCNWAIMVRCK